MSPLFGSEEARREYEDDMFWESLTPEQRTREEVRAYVHLAGAEDPEAAWILSPYDTWEQNPHYTGPPVPHPDDLEPYD